MDEVISNMQTPVACTGITLSANAIAFESTTDTQTLTATVTPSNTTDSVIWSSDNTDIATVSDGIITPIADGSCIITATCGTQSATCSVTIRGITYPLFR